jgi:glycine hydroxymethyltransferase
VVTTTTHKTLCGPRAGLILCKEEYAQAIDKAVFPGQQGGPLEHVIAAKAVCLRIAKSDVFRDRQRQTVANAKAFGEALKQGGLDVLTGGTDVHLVLVDLGMDGLDGREAEDRLAEVGITVNRNAIPFDQRPPMKASGLRIGTPALTTRGFLEEDLKEIGDVIVQALDPGYDDARREELSERTRALMELYPLYSELPAPVQL